MSELLKKISILFSVAQLPAGTKPFSWMGCELLGRSQAAARGIFPRDPTLKDFLRDKPACLVTLRCIWNCARRRTASETRAVLENYVVHGGDEGLTRIAARTSCNLPVEAEQSVDVLEEALAGLDDAITTRLHSKSMSWSEPSKRKCGAG